MDSNRSVRIAMMKRGIPAEWTVVSMLSSYCLQAAPKIVVCSAGTSSGTQDIQAGLVLVLTLPYSSGPSGLEASMNCRSKHTRVVSKCHPRCYACVLHKPCMQSCASCFLVPMYKDEQRAAYSLSLAS